MSMIEKAHEIINRFKDEDLAFFLEEHLRCPDCPNFDECKNAVYDEKNCYQTIMRTIDTEHKNAQAHNDTAEIMAAYMAADVMKGVE